VKQTQSTRVLSGTDIKATESMFQCKDQWDRPWKAVVSSATGIALPVREFAYWCSRFAMGGDTLGAAIKVDQQMVVRRIVSLDVQHTVGERAVSCVKETESVVGIENTEHLFSTAVPGGLVRSTVTAPVSKVKFELLDFSADGR